MEMYDLRNRSYENVFIDEPSCMTYDLRPRSEDRYVSTSNRVLNRPYLEDALSTFPAQLDVTPVFSSKKNRWKTDGLPEILISSEYLSPDGSTVFGGIESITTNSPIPDRVDIKYYREDLLKPILTTTTYPDDDFFDTLQKTRRGSVTTCDNCERLRRSPKQTQSFAIRSRSHDDSSPRFSNFDRLRSRSFSTKNSVSYLNSTYPHNIDHHKVPTALNSKETGGMIQRIKNKVNDLKLPFQKNTYIDDRTKYNLEKSKLILDRYSNSPRTWDVVKNSSMRDQYIDDYLKQVESRRMPNYNSDFSGQLSFNKSFKLDDSHSRRYSEFRNESRITSSADRSTDSYKKPYYKHVTFAPETNYLSNRTTFQNTSYSFPNRGSTTQNFHYFPSNSSSLSWYKTNYTADLPDIRITNLNRSYSNITLPSEKYMNEFRKIPVYQKYLKNESKGSLKKFSGLENESETENDRKLIHIPKEEAIMMNQVPQLSVEKTLDESSQEVSEQFYRLQTLSEKPVEMTDPLVVAECLPDISLQQAIVIEEGKKEKKDSAQNSKTQHEHNTLQNEKKTEENKAIKPQSDEDVLSMGEETKGQKNDEKKESTLPVISSTTDAPSDPTLANGQETAVPRDVKETESSQIIFRENPELQTSNSNQEQKNTENNATTLDTADEKKSEEADKESNPAESPALENEIKIEERQTKTGNEQQIDSKALEPRSAKNSIKTETHKIDRFPAEKEPSKENDTSQKDEAETNLAQNNEVSQATLKTKPETYFQEDETMRQDDTYYKTPEQHYEYDDHVRVGTNLDDTTDYYKGAEQQPYEQVHHEFGKHPEQHYEEYQQQPYVDHIQKPFDAQHGQYAEHPQQMYEEQPQQLYDERPREPYEDQVQQPYDDHTQRPYDEQAYDERLQQPYDKHLQQPYDEHLQQPYEEHLQQPYEEENQYPDQQNLYEKHSYEQSHPQYEDKEHYDEQTQNFPKDPNLYPEYENRPEDTYNENQTYDQRQTQDEYKQYDGRRHGSQEYQATEEAYVHDRAAEYSAYPNDYPVNDQEYRVTQQDYAPNTQGKEYIRKVSEEYSGGYSHEPRPQGEYRETVEEYRNADVPGQYVHHNEEYSQEQYEQRDYQNERGKYPDPNVDYSASEYALDPNYLNQQQEYPEHAPQQYGRDLVDQNTELYSQEDYHENYTPQKAYPMQETTQYEETARLQNEGYREPFYEHSNQ